MDKGQHKHEESQEIVLTWRKEAIVCALCKSGEPITNQVTERMCLLINSTKSRETTAH